MLSERRDSHDKAQRVEKGSAGVAGVNVYVGNDCAGFDFADDASRQDLPLAQWAANRENSLAFHNRCLVAFRLCNGSDQDIWDCGEIEPQNGNVLLGISGQQDSGKFALIVELNCDVLGRTDDVLVCENESLRVDDKASTVANFGPNCYDAVLVPLEQGGQFICGTCWRLRPALGHLRIIIAQLDGLLRLGYDYFKVPRIPFALKLHRLGRRNLVAPQWHFGFCSAIESGLDRNLATV